MNRFLLLLLAALAPITLPAYAATEPGAVNRDSYRMAAEASVDRVLLNAREHLAEEDPTVLDAELRIEQVREGLASKHYRYGQWIDAQRVHGGELVISVGSDGRILGRNVSLSSASPTSSGSAASFSDLLVDDPDLRSATVVSRTPAYRNIDGAPRPVMRVMIEDAPFRFSVWEVDPATGDVLSKTPLYASAAARVFPANPVTTLNDASLRDGNDSAAAVPPGSYAETELSGLGTVGQLTGPRVRVVDIDSPFTTRATIELSLMAERDRPEFEEINAYHHLDQTQLYLQSLGYIGSRQIIPNGVRVDAHANRGADNSYFTATSAGPTLLFGDGGVDDAEDPDIILHEFGHAIHDWLSPGVLFGSSGSQGRAISEGFGDYWAFSSGYDATLESGRDPYCIGDWDARCDGPGCAYPPSADCLRRVDEELTIADFDPSNASGTEHRNGRIWSRFLRDVFERIVELHGPEQGRRIADVIVLEGLLGLPVQPRFEDVIARMILADSQLNGAMHRTTICTAARSRGFNVPSACEPQMRGETIALHGGEAMTIPAGGGAVEGEVILRSEAIIERVLVDVELGAEAPYDLEIKLISPDGESVSLKRSGDPLPRRSRFGRDALPAESLSPFEGRANPGTWTIRFSSASSLVQVVGWRISFALDDDAELLTRHATAGGQTIPAVAHTPGAEGTFFVSDIAVANTGGAAELMLIFTPSGEDGTSRYSAVRVDAPAGQSFVIADVVRSIFDSEGTGSLEIRGPASVRVTSRTYNRTPEGSFGQSIPLVRHAAGPGERVFLTQLRRNLDYRTNVGLIETSGQRSAALITLRDRNGLAAGSATVSLEPFMHRQIPVGSFAELAEIDPGWIEVEVTGSVGSVAAYASVVDNRTGDSVFVPAEAASESRRDLIVPAAAMTPGARSTNWTTDLWILNPSVESHAAQLHFFGSDGKSVTREITAPAISSTLLSNVVGDFFETEGAGWILVDDSSLLVSSRTWNDASSGTYGQFIGALTPEDATARDHAAIVPTAVLNDLFRTNVGMTETSGQSTTLRVEVLDGYGNLVCARTVPLAPFQHWQASLENLGCVALDRGRIEISHLDGNGRIVAYGSIVDQNTGDPTYVRAE